MENHRGETPSNNPLEETGDKIPNNTMDMSALTEEDRLAVVEFVPKKKGRDTSTGTGDAEADMKAVYDELSQHVADGIHDAVEEVVESAGGTALKMTNFIYVYAKICNKLRASTD